MCCGWEDVTDHNILRHDLALQTALGRDTVLASGPMFSRLEATATAAHEAALHDVLLGQFFASRSQAPEELILDIDATHVPLHGEQELAHFHACYDNYCYLPLYVFCGQDLLACVLRPSDREPTSVLCALVKLLAARLRQQWPGVRLVVRADSGFCRPKALRRFEQWGVDYVIGLQKNVALEWRVALAELAVADAYRDTGEKQRLIERLYCARGEAENRIKEAQLDLFGRRASCGRFLSNQLRLLLAGTDLNHACTATIRVKLLKIGAAIMRNTRRVRVLMASHHPLKHVFFAAAQALAP